MCFNNISCVGLEPGTDYQATRKVLLNQMLKLFAIPPFNIIQQPFYSIQQNRTDVEAVCLGLKTTYNTTYDTKTATYSKIQLPNYKLRTTLASLLPIIYNTTATTYTNASIQFVLCC